MKRKRGFTVVELLAAVAIVAVLAGILVVAVNQALIFFRGVTDRNQIDQIAAALEIYKTKFGEYPPDGTDVDAIEKHLLKRWPELLGQDWTDPATSATVPDPVNPSQNMSAIRYYLRNVVPGGYIDNDPNYSGNGPLWTISPTLSLSFWLCGDEFVAPDPATARQDGMDRFRGSFIELKRGFAETTDVGTAQKGVNWNIVGQYLCDAKGFPVIYFRGGERRDGSSLYEISGAAKTVPFSFDGEEIVIAPYSSAVGVWFAADTFQLILPGVDGDYSTDEDNVTNFAERATMDSETP